MSPLNAWPASATSLHVRTIRFDDRTVRDASIFPFFDGRGRVTWLMLAARESRCIVLIPHVRKQVQVPVWGPARIRLRWNALGDPAPEVLDAVAPLWHYDPWWVLREERYAGHHAVPVLVDTNCVNSFTREVTEAYFTRDLSRLCGVRDKLTRGQRLTPWDDAYLPPRGRPPVARAAKALTTWRLDPIWNPATA